MADPKAQHASVELAHRAAPDGDAVVALVEYPDVTDFGLGLAAGSLGCVAVDQVAVEVEGDPVGADNDPVVWAVEEVGVQRGVGGDRLAAADLTCCQRPV